MASFDKTPDHLLQTKLYPPRVPQRLVRRQELLERLEQQRERPITLVSAPAGYGKSTLVTQWLRSNGGRYAWLSLDAYDSDLVTVLAYIIAALQKVYPQFGHDSELLLELPRLPAAEKVADILLLDLQKLDEPLHLVLDDFHTIADPSIHLFMTRFLQRLPQTLSLVIISRADPPLDLMRMRGRGQLREIRGGDLCFSLEETTTLIEQIVGQSLSAETARAIAERNEGWPVGIRMAAMSLRTADDHGEFTRRYAGGGQKLVSDYLLGEVLDRLPKEERMLLLRTAVVDRFCAPLVDVLAGQSVPGSSGYDFLQMLWSSNFFLIALDVQGTWYRYHHLFRQLLLQQLQQLFSAEEIVGLHLQAAAWFEAVGYIEDAIIHAVKAGDSQAAARLVEKHVHEALNQENWRRVDRWVNMLPEEALRRPGILAIQAMLEQFRYRIGSMIPLLDAAQEGLNNGESDYSAEEIEAWTGAVKAFKATVFFPSNSTRDSLHYANQAMHQVDPAALFVQSIAELWYIYALQQSGRLPQAIRLAQQKIANQIGPPDVRTNRLMLAQCAVYCAEADVAGLRNVAQAYLELATRTEHQVSLGWSKFFLGWSAYQENQLAEAERYFSMVLDMRYHAHVRTAVDGITGLILTKCARHERADAENVLQILREFILEQGAVGLLPLVDSLALRIEVESASGASIAGDGLQLATQMASDLWELPVLTACKTSIQCGNGERLLAAEASLARCRDFAQSRNAKRQLIRIGTLQALLHEARAERQLALQTLRETLSIGEAGGVLRYFVDEGPGLLPLLRELQEQGVASSYIERILQAYPREGVVNAAALSDEGEEQSTLSATAVVLLSELTNREMEVLLLLGERLTNKEIAARLHISPRTVKKHTINLYQKLEVDGRRQAVARAREVGII